MTSLSVDLRVSSIRSRGKFGGVIFTGVCDSESTYVVVCDFKLVPDAHLVEKGQCWHVEGHVETKTITPASGVRIIERQISAAYAMLLRLTGENIVAWIAESPDCTGIGVVKASKLYQRFGPGLATLMERRDIEALSEVISQSSAKTLCTAFARHSLARTLMWLDGLAIPRRIGAKVIKFYKEQAEQRIKFNPYLLLSFEASWKTVDDLAIYRFGIEHSDTRRLDAAIEEALYCCLYKGDTCLLQRNLRRYLARLLNSVELARKAIEHGRGNFQYVVHGNRYQPSGMYIIERYIAERIAKLLGGEVDAGQLSLFATSEAKDIRVNNLIDQFENDHDLTLTAEQRQAVEVSTAANIALILGGAGTGKTTVLKAIYSTITAVRPGIAVFQLALAGRAAQRMSEATGRESLTIAAFLRRFQSDDIPPGSLVVVDEVSMIDVILMYRLLRHLPTGVRLILVGDPSQLPPIGPGLVLHALAGTEAIPQVELKTVKRQSSESGIPFVASAIRRHEIPSWTEYKGIGSGVSFVPCPLPLIDLKVLQIYDELGGSGTDFDVQILSLTKDKQGGVRNINQLFHEKYQSDAPTINYMDEEYGIVCVKTMDRLALKVGDLVMFTENDYHLGLRNGALGVIVKALAISEPDEPCCIVRFEDLEYALTLKQLSALTHAYSITVHKSQGSQFRRVIIPVRASRILDQALLYTAVTRGIEQVVFVGESEPVCSAIRSAPAAAARNVGLPYLLSKTLAEGSEALSGALRS